MTAIAYRRRVIEVIAWDMVVSVIVCTIAYLIFVLCAVSVLPDGFELWTYLEGEHQQ